MVSVIFEVWPHPEHRAGYLDWAAELKNELVKMEGFISIERFQSLTDPDKLLSLQFWRDDACLISCLAQSGSASRGAVSRPQDDVQGIPAADRRGDPRLWPQRAGCRRRPIRGAPTADECGVPALMLLMEALQS